jgi:nucleotide-binding universal stress UspA family protein
MATVTLPQRVLLAVESSELAQPALLAAHALCSRRDTNVDLLHVWEPIPFTPPDAAFYQGGKASSYRHVAITHGEHELRALASQAAQLGVAIGKQEIREGSPAQTIADVAANLGSELVIVTNHQRKGLSRWMQGSVSRRVAQLSNCPVLVVPLHDEAENAET